MPLLIYSLAYSFSTFIIPLLGNSLPAPGKMSIFLVLQVEGVGLSLLSLIRSH